MKTKTKNKDKPTKNHKKIAVKYIITKKMKAMGNITPTMDHYPRNEQIGDTDPSSGMSC